MPYLNESVGIFPEAQNYYKSAANLNGSQSTLNDNYLGELGRRGNDAQQFQNAGFNMMSGQYNSTGSADLNAARAGQGALDPTQAQAKLLSGNPDNPYLDKMHQANINTSMRGYNDALSDFNTQTMPGINNDAFAAGQYGGSRQGIAQGLATQQMERNARDLGIAAMDSGNQLYGSAYENAQGRMANTADNLNNQAAQNSQFNLGLDLQQKAAAANNAQTGLQDVQTGWGIQDNIFNQQQSILSAPQVQWQNAINQYANIISPGAGMGGSQLSQIPIYSNNMGQLAGGAMSVAGLLSSLK
jgi:hypothetical protein